MLLNISLLEAEYIFVRGWNEFIPTQKTKWQMPSQAHWLKNWFTMISCHLQKHAHTLMYYRSRLCRLHSCDVILCVTVRRQYHYGHILQSKMIIVSLVSSRTSWLTVPMNSWNLLEISISPSDNWIKNPEGADVNVMTGLLQDRNDHLLLIQATKKKKKIFI